jgi:hypothetical protein
MVIAVFADKIKNDRCFRDQVLASGDLAIKDTQWIGPGPPFAILAEAFGPFTQILLKGLLELDSTFRASE